MAEESVFDRYRASVEKPLARLFDVYGRPRSAWFVVGLFGNLIAQAASLLPPLVLGTAIDAIFTGDGAYSLPLVPGSWLPRAEAAQFELSILLIGGAFAATAVFTWVYGVAANQFAHSVMHAVRVDCFDKLSRLDMSFFDDKQTGEVMSILSSDTENLERFLDDALMDSVRLGAMLLGIAGLLFYINYELAVVTLVAIPVMVAFTIWFMRKAEPRYEARRASVGNLNTRLENNIAGMELTKTTASEDYETGRVRTASKRLFEDTMAVLKLSYFYRPGMELLAGVAFVVTFAVGGVWLTSGPPLFFTQSISVGDFVVFLFMTQRFVTPLAEVSNIVDQYENAKASSERVFGLMDIPVSVEEPDDAVVLDDVAGRVEYDDVTFAYEGGPDADEAADTLREAERVEATLGGDDRDGPVIEDVSFTAEPGDTVALVGPTGAGKSTLAKLLLRLYDVSDGSSVEGIESDGAVRVDGHDVREVTLDSLRDATGYVSQDTFLFDGTIAENIRYGQFDEDHEAVVAAAKAAEAHEFIDALPNGYETRVGERGVKLSGGQRQRVALARVVLQDPEILILDEATSAVDTETEYLIQRSLDRLSEDRTSLVIAHRLSTVRDADTILVIDDGRVVERGTHDELLEEDGLYATLWGIQVGDGSVEGSALDPDLPADDD